MSQAFELLKAGRYAEAIPFAEQAVRMAGSPEIQAKALINLSYAHGVLGRFDVAEPLIKRAIALLESLETDHGDLAGSLGNLGRIYFEAGRFEEAQQIFIRANAIVEKVYASQQHMIPSFLENLADVYSVQGKFKEAEPLLERAVAIYRQGYGDSTALLSRPMAELAQLFYLEGRYAEAELLLSRAIELHEAQFNLRHPDFGRMFFILARVQEAQGRLKQAEGSFQRALSIWQGSLNATHPFVAGAQTGLGLNALAQAQPALAVQRLREATGILIRRSAPGGQRSVGTFSAADVFRLYAVALHRAGTSRENSEEGFAAAQRGRQTETALALAQMGERHLAGSGNLGALIRERQDIQRQWRAADQGLSSALANGNSQSASAVRAQMAGFEKRLSEIGRNIAQQYPHFAALSGVAPLSVKEVQNLLKPEEVLIQFLETSEIGQNKPEMYAWLVGKSEFRWEKLAISPQTLEILAATLRCGLDGQMWEDPAGRERCSKLIGRAPEAQEPLPFDLKAAHALFEALFGPFREQIAEKKLIVIPSEGMAGIPLGVLVADAGTAASQPFAEVKWLGGTNALSILPAASSLQALRKQAGESGATQPFAGFGDPVLRGNERCRRVSVPERCPSAAPDREIRVAAQERGTLSRMPLPGLFRQGLANVEALQVQCPLPETAFELRCVAESLGAAPENVHLREQATEKTVKSIPLQNYRVLHFATHGLLAIDSLQVTAGSVTEPALLLTPPGTPTESDDGLLTASEIMQLKLDADWVVLSACNTAGGATIASGEALSGLARSFFYAGAHAVLVSHWAVDSTAAIKVTTQTFAELRQQPETGRAEALRRSMLRLMRSSTKAESHPAYWAAFSLIGTP